MPRRRSRIRSRLTTVTCATLGVLAFQDAANADVNLTVEATTGYTNNLLRVPDGDSDVPVSLGLTGTWIESTKHLSADVQGRVDGVMYLKDTYPEEVLGQINASVIWWAVPEQFSLVLMNVYGQTSTDPFSPIGPANRQNTNYLSTGPDWFIPLGARTRAYLGGRYGSVRYEEVADSNSERLLGIVGLDRAVSSSSRLGVQASTETVDYDSASQPDVDRNEAYVRYEYSRGTQSELVVNAGHTWLYSDSEDRSAPLLQVRLSRQVTSSVDLQLELVSQFSDAGRRFAAGESLESAAGNDPILIPEFGIFEERGGRGIVRVPAIADDPHLRHRRV